MASATKPIASVRRRHIAAIHASAAKLGMDTSDKNPASEYRSMLQSIGGRTSTTEMDDAALARVVKHLARTTGAGRDKPKDGWHAEKMRGLWRELGELKVLRDPSERGLQEFVHKTTQRSALRFLNSHEGNRVVEALKAWVARERAKK